jgi:hypothetical protein
LQLKTLGYWAGGESGEHGRHPWILPLVRRGIVEVPVVVIAVLQHLVEEGNGIPVGEARRLGDDHLGL